MPPLRYKIGVLNFVSRYSLCSYNVVFGNAYIRAGKYREFQWSIIPKVSLDFCRMRCWQLRYYEHHRLEKVVLVVSRKVRGSLITTGVIWLFYFDHVGGACIKHGKDPHSFGRCFCQEGRFGTCLERLFRVRKRYLLS